MVIRRADVIGIAGMRGRLAMRILRACLFLYASAFHISARAEKVVTVLVPLEVATTDAVSEKSGYLAVAAPGGGRHSKATSYLFFDVSALPAAIRDDQFTSLRLQLVPKEGAERGMAIAVTLAAKQSESEDPKRSTRSTPYRLVSPPLPKDANALELRSDSVILPPSLIGALRRSPGLQLRLLAEGNASRRVYYGLNTRASTNDVEHPERLPRLIISYDATAPRDDNQFSEPSTLNLTQTDGRQAGSSLRALNLPLGDLDASETDEAFNFREVATGSLSVVPVVYRGGLYVVRNEGPETYLQQFSAETGAFTGKQLLLPSGVLAGSIMVVDDYGRLRIVTNDAILGTTVDPQLGTFTPLVRRDFAFNQTPRIVVPGQDGTLYIVQNSVFALNPDVWTRTAAGKETPVKLWEIGIEDPDSARITLNPDGTFLYVLARFAGKGSRLIAVNAQTGGDVRLDGGTVNTSGRTVSWVSGMNFERTLVSQSIPIGSSSCTVSNLSPDGRRLTCQEDLGKQRGIRWAAFPVDLIAFRRPVVSKTPQGDFVYIAGRSETKAYLWGVRNDPVLLRSGDLARFTGAWRYLARYNERKPWEGDELDWVTPQIGQPLLDATIPAKGSPSVKKELYFLEKRTNLGNDVQLSVVDPLTGRLLRDYLVSSRRILVGANNKYYWDIDLESDPVVDGDGKIVFWSYDELYLIDTRMNLPSDWGVRPFGAFNVRSLKLPAKPRLLFGADGVLYSVAASTVNLLGPDKSQPSR